MEDRLTDILESNVNSITPYLPMELAMFPIYQIVAKLGRFQWQRGITAPIEPILEKV
jgi:hypothetical protein